MEEKLAALKPFALLLLRLVMGGAFIAHGYPKLFAVTEQRMQFFQSHGFPGWAVYVSGGVEFFGGILLLAGLFTRLSAFLLSGEMAVAFLRVHYPAAVAKGGWLGFFGSGGDEFPLLLSASCFLLVILGGGAFSLDALVSLKKKIGV